MFRYTTFEKQAIGVMHIQWLKIVYSVLPYMLISFYHGSEKLVQIGTIDMIWFLTIIPARYVNDGFLYSKTPEVGTKLFNRLAVLVVILANIILPLDIPMRVALVSALCCTNYYWNDKWGYIYATKKQAIADIIYVPFYAAFVIWPIVFNPLGDVYWSLYIITSSSDIIWLIFKSLYLKPAIKDTYFGKMDLKLEWKGLINATKRATGDMLYDGLLYVGKIAILTSASSNLYLSSLFLLASNLPSFSLSRAIVGQMKKGIIQSIPFNPLKIMNTSIIIIIVEVLPILIIMGTVFIDVPFQINTFIAFTAVYLLTVATEMYSNTMKMLILFRNQASVVAVVGLCIAIINLTSRVVFQNPISSYMTQIATYSIVAIFYWSKMDREPIQRLIAVEAEA